MKIEADFSAVKLTTWREYAIRFVLGGAICVAAGLIANRWGPAVGGLFLAFPAIFPATSTLVESHERKKADRQSAETPRMGINASGANAAGAAMGSIGLIAFAVVVWRLSARLPIWETLALATLAWIVVACAVWMIRQRI